MICDKNVTGWHDKTASDLMVVQEALMRSTVKVTKTINQHFTRAFTSKLGQLYVCHSSPDSYTVLIDI